jgi:amphi-Trp domain-containing protein
MEHYEREVLPRLEVARRLRHLAEQLEKGTVSVGRVSGPLPELVELKLEFESRDGKGELEIEIEWPS